MLPRLSASVTLAVSAGGAVTTYSEALSGQVLGVYYTPGTLDTGADLTITTATSLQTILTITNGGTSNIWWYPRVGMHDATGVAATTDGTRLLREPVNLIPGEQIKVVVAQGGVSLTGAIRFLVG